MNPLDQLFTAWLAGSLSADEARQLQVLLRDPGARRRWRALADVEGALAERGSAIVAEPAQASPHTTRRLRVRPARRVVWPWTLAASLLLACGGAWFVQQPVQQVVQQPGQQPVQQPGQESAPVSAVALPALTAPMPAPDRDLPTAAGRRLDRGERMTGPLDVAWPDGSVVHLAPRATARIPEGERGIVLESGDLAMSATHQQPGAPFVVVTAQARCIVVGTRFSVRCAGESTSLLVEEGRVAFQANGGHEQMVHAGDHVLAGRAQPPSAGLVGWWPLDEGHGDEARDASGQNHPGRIRGPQWTAQGLRFPGGNAHVSIAALGRLATLQESDYSISAWYQPEVLPPGSVPPNRDALAVIAGRSGWTLGLHLKPDGGFFMQHFLADHQPQTADSPAMAQPGRWSQVVGVVSRRLGYTQLAVDGALVPGMRTWTPGAAGNAYDPDQSWVIGIGIPGDPECRWPAQGLIREVRLYDRALDSHDILQLAQVR